MWCYIERDGNMPNIPADFFSSLEEMLQIAIVIVFWLYIFIDNFMCDYSVEEIEVIDNNYLVCINVNIDFL